MKRHHELRLKDTTGVPPLFFGVTAYCTTHPESKLNHLHMKISDCCPEFYSGKKRAGAVNGCLGGAIELDDEASGLVFTIKPTDLFECFRAALQKHPEWMRLTKGRRK